MSPAIDASEITIEPERFEIGLNVFAVWRGKRVGHAFCVWDDDEKTRLLFCDLKVEEDALIEPRRLFRTERRANFQRLGIGTRLLEEVERQARLMGAREILGKVVESDLRKFPDLLEWYLRKGFKISKAVLGDSFPPAQVSRITMGLEKLDSQDGET